MTTERSTFEKDKLDRSGWNARRLINRLTTELGR